MPEVWELVPNPSSIFVCQEGEIEIPPIGMACATLVQTSDIKETLQSRSEDGCCLGSRRSYIPTVLKCLAYPANRGFLTIV